MNIVRDISSESGIGFGVNLFEQSPTPRARGVSTNIVGIVGDFPWGPTNEVTDITSNAERVAAFYPNVFEVDDDTYPVRRAFLNKNFPGGEKIVRIAATSQATSTRTFDDASSGDSVKVDANYPGLLGDQIKITWTANADDATARDATVTIGTKYTAVYENVATIVSAALVVTDPGDPYVTFSKAVGATLVPAAIAATALTGGADGTAVAADYVGSDVSEVGIQLFYSANVKANVLFVAEPPDALVDSINAGLEAYATGADKGMVVLCTPEGLTSTEVKTDVADYRDDRIIYCYPKVYTTNLYDADLASVLVDGNAFVASVLVNIDPEISPGGEPGRDYLKGVSNLENSSMTLITYEQLRKKGLSPFIITDYGCILYGCVTTDLTDGKTEVFRRRMTDYIKDSLGGLCQLFVGKKLDLALASQTLGANTGALIGSMTGFLQDLDSKNRIVSKAENGWRIDPFSENTQENLNSNRWYIGTAVKFHPAMNEIVVKHLMGETVTIEEE